MGGGPPPSSQGAGNAGSPVKAVSAPQQPRPGGGMVASMAPVVFTAATPADANATAYPFTMEQFVVPLNCTA